MGDMADFVNDSYPVEDWPLQEKEVQCAKCGEHHLHWAPTKFGKWWLMNERNEWHSCGKREAK